MCNNLIEPSWHKEDSPQHYRNAVAYLTEQLLYHHLAAAETYAALQDVRDDKHHRACSARLDGYSAVQGGVCRGICGAYVAVVGEVAVGPVHVADRAEQQVGQRLVQGPLAVQQLVCHGEQQAPLTPQAECQACTAPTQHFKHCTRPSSRSYTPRLSLGDAEGRRTVRAQGQIIMEKDTSEVRKCALFEALEV